MRSIHKKGMTLFEVVVASSIMSVLAALGLSAFIDVMQMVNNQDANTRMDQRANAVLREMTKLLKPAILPFAVGDGKTGPFEDIDNPKTKSESNKHGFGILGKDWKDSLKDGMDEIAFVVPIDAQEVGDFLDGKNHMQIGQVRGGISYLSARPHGIPNSGESFYIRDGNELVNALADVAPDRLGSWPFNSKIIPSDSDWQSLYGSRVGPDSPVTAFTIIRFAPVMDGSGNPIVVSETGVLSDGVTAYDIDLDDDGKTDGEFHVGALQVLYSGGDSFYHLGGTPLSVVGPESVPPMVVPLTSFVILRRSMENDRTPIFRLVNYNNDIKKSGDNAGMITDTGGGNESGNMALNIKFLMIENEELARGQSMTKSLVNHLRPRWYETTIVLKNMER